MPRLMTFEDLVIRHGSGAGQKLNLGCGWDIRPGFVNADLAPLPGVDVVLSANAALPFASESFDVVVAKDIVEHLGDLAGSMGDMHRVLKPGGVLLISTVHFTSRDVYVDPTHLRGFSIRTFDFYVRGGGEVDRSYYHPYAFASLDDAHIQFHAKMGKGKFLLWDWVMEPLVNLRRGVQDLYETTGVSRAFPAGNVLVALRK